VEDATSVSEEKELDTSDEDSGRGRDFFRCKSCATMKTRDAFPSGVTKKKVKTGESKGYQWRRNVCKSCFNENRRNKRRTSKVVQ